VGDKSPQWEMEIVNPLQKQRKESEELLFSKGVLYLTGLCSAEIFQALDTIEFRQDNVFLAAYPKCSDLWENWIHLTSFHLKYYKLSASLSYGYYGSLLSLALLQKIKNAPSPRLFSTHLHYDDIPKAVFENKVKVLVVFRNPKDVAVSYYHFYNKNPGLPNVSSWDEFFQKFMSGEVMWSSYFDHALSWNKHMDEQNIMIITYEEMKENLPGGVKKIAEFLGFSLPEEKIQSIIENATFKSMSNKSQETHGTLAPMLFRKGTFIQSDNSHFKNLFTEAQSQEMDVKFTECLAGTKLGAKLKYDKYCKY
uniref:Sulfotransferase n=1 Tax=Chelonoidis abingdonii TaxID=106734 RepID=A0A8C0H5S8_CHEAB